MITLVVGETYRYRDTLSFNSEKTNSMALLLIKNMRSYRIHPSGIMSILTDSILLDAGYNLLTTSPYIDSIVKYFTLPLFIIIW